MLKYHVGIKIALRLRIKLLGLRMFQSKFMAAKETLVHRRSYKVTGAPVNLIVKGLMDLVGLKILFQTNVKIFAVNTMEK
jgi:hypothetical protein